MTWGSTLHFRRVGTWFLLRLAAGCGIRCVIVPRGLLRTVLFDRKPQRRWGVRCGLRARPGPPRRAAPAYLIFDALIPIYTAVALLGS